MSNTNSNKGRAALAAPHRRGPTPGLTKKHKRSIPVEREVWEILDEEMSAQYAAFKLYRDMHPAERSFQDVAKILGLSPSYIGTLSTKHRWIERVTAWDFHIESARLELSEAYQLDMFKRHADICTGLLSKVKERLAKMNPRDLQPRDVAQWIEVATKIERLSRGNVEQTAANINQINLHIDGMSKLTDRELEDIIDNEKKRKMRLGAIDIKALPAARDRRGKS